ncbi:MAG: hypothetical protein AB2421_02535 [Thermotaleaceae bacterium]
MIESVILKYDDHQSRRSHLNKYDFEVNIELDIITKDDSVERDTYLCILKGVDTNDG